MIVSSRTPRKPPARSDVVYRYSSGRTFIDPRTRGGPYTTVNTGFLLIEDQQNRAGLTGNAILQEDGSKLLHE
jgi:hypothetical protein